MLNGGGIDLIPVELLREVAEFYDRHDRLVERYDRLNAFTQDHVLPFLDAEITHFYASERQLRPMYELYRQELLSLIEYAEETIDLGLAIQGQVEIR